MCLFLVFSILPSLFTPLQASFASFFLSIFLCPFPYFFPIFPPFCVSFPPIFTQSTLLFYFFFHSTFTFPAFFLSSSKNFSFIHFSFSHSFCLRTVCFLLFPSFTLYIFHSSSLQSTTVINNRVYKSKNKHLSEWRNIRKSNAVHKATQRAPSYPATHANCSIEIWKVDVIPWTNQRKC